MKCLLNRASEPDLRRLPKGMEMGALVLSVRMCRRTTTSRVRGLADPHRLSDPQRRSPAGSAWTLVLIPAR
jgi:hypothetical protein